MKRTTVYVDGFNLYYRRLSGTRFKWLDIRKMCELLLPAAEISHIRYFTARVKPRASDPDAPRRQGLYLRALRTLPNFSIQYGNFLSNTKRRPRVDTGEFVTVHNTEEKGSDVNLAANMITDGFLDKYDVAVLLSNDSDFGEATRIVAEVIGKDVVVITPLRGRKAKPSGTLKKHALFVKSIGDTVLAASVFPKEMKDERGKFQAPAEWEFPS